MNDSSIGAAPRLSAGPSYNAPSASAPHSLPEVVEVKRYLDGRVKEFRCGLVEADDVSQVLLYISHRAGEIFGLAMPAGTVTFGYYWANRDYNVYHWQAPAGDTIAVYFNLSADTRLGREVMEWRDLAIDILYTPSGRLEVLDEDEFPDDAPAAIRTAMLRGKQTILDHHQTIVAEVETRSRALWPRVFGERESR